MSTLDLQCNLCSSEYDLSRHIPVNMPICGHALCSKCALNSLKNSNSSHMQCPFDSEHKVSFDMRLEEEELFAKNLVLITLLQGKESFQERKSSIEFNQEAPATATTMETQSKTSENLSNIMDSLDNLEAKVQNEMEHKEIKLLNKRISKLKDASKDSRQLNMRLLNSLKKKKGDMSGLVSSVKQLYVKFGKLSSGYEELSRISEQRENQIGSLTKEVESLNNKLFVSRALYEESCQISEDLRAEKVQKKDSQKELEDQILKLEEEKKELLEMIEYEKTENLKLVECLELKDTEKRNIKEKLAKEVQKQERSKERIQREKDEVSMNRDGFSILALKKKMEVERFREELEEKDDEILKLKEKIEDLEEDKQIYVELSNKKELEKEKSKCEIF